MGKLTKEQLLQILDNEVLCKRLLDSRDNCDFLGGTISKEECLEEFEHLLYQLTFHRQSDQEFGIIIKILNRFYLKKMKDDPFLFYENEACLEIFEQYQQNINKYSDFQIFLNAINFDFYQREIGKYYHQQMKQNNLLNDYETKDFFNYLMIYRNHMIPHSYLRYAFFTLFEKHNVKLTNRIYAQLFRFLILDLLKQLNLNQTVILTTLKNEKRPFIFKQTTIEINLSVIGETLESNLSYIPYLFDLFEKRYKYDSFVHNKYEEIKNKKQVTIKEILGSSFFEQNYSYLSIEKMVSDQSLIDRLRFFEDVIPRFYKRMIEDYEKQIIAALKNTNLKIEPVHLVLTLDNLLEQSILLVPEVIQNQPYLQLEFHLNGQKKKLTLLLEQYEKELEQISMNGDESHKQMAFYYEQTILTTSLNSHHLIDEFVSLLHYQPRFLKTGILIEKIFLELFVSEINDHIQNHILSSQDLERLLSKLNQYMIRFYEMKQKEISKYILRDSSKWKFYSDHLMKLYQCVQYISDPSLYETSYLNLTQTLNLEEARRIQKDVIKKKIKNQKIYMVILVILILIFSTSLFFLIRTIWQYSIANDDYKEIQVQINQIKPVPILIPDPNRTEFPMNDNIPQIDFTPLKQENSEVIAWIRIDETPINYPVVQGQDNEFYLSHLYNKKYNISGSIFGDYRNGEDFQSDNMVLYGHNLRNESMFGSLKKYKDSNYLEQHKYVWLITPQATYQYQIYAAYEFNSLKEKYIFNFSSEESFKNYLDQIKRKSILSSDLEVGPNDHILTLSTCTDEESEYRFIVIAKRVTTYLVIDNDMSTKENMSK